MELIKQGILYNPNFFLCQSSYLVLQSAKHINESKHNNLFEYVTQTLKYGDVEKVQSSSYFIKIFKLDRMCR